MLLAMLHWAEIIGGIALLLVILYDIFQSVVLPRPAINKLATVRYLIRGIYWMWRWVGNRISSIPRRERWLATYGPVAVLTIFVAWGLALVLAYGLIIDGVRDELHPVPDSFGTSLYFSATTLVPLSYGDIVPIGLPARLATIAESTTGIIFAALVITLLFSVYEAFQRREELVVSLDALAGAPLSGVQILETAAAHEMRDELIKTFDDWKGWAAAVLESHLAYPSLVFFRSSHDNEAWLNSFGAVMDAAVLVMSTVEDKSEGPAKLMYRVGNHLVEDLSWYVRRWAVPADTPVIERFEFDEAWARLKQAGYRCHAPEEAWTTFAKFRSNYAAPINGLARALAIIPAQWIGDRSYLPHRQREQRRRLLRRKRR
ncbi:MAG: potassium channel family protein [Candidatus Dormibacteraeota bacterium]|nr:potassium channel family protein [Candidatus Dormibacteraeota bacterium]